MRNTTGTQTKQPPRGRKAQAVVALLASAGLRAEGVERCPDPACPLCAGPSRVAA